MENSLGPMRVCTERVEMYIAYENSTTIFLTL